MKDGKNMAKDIKSMKRRDFMKKAGLGIGAVGAVASGLPKTAAAAAPGVGEGTGKSGYRETEHVKKYYATARF
jgi:hypothetical protein